MRILLLTTAFNSLTQRIYVELAERGHELSVEFDINDATTIEAIALFEPELVIAPYLKRAIPESVWRQHLCLIVHPGVPGDRGPSALDWAILDGETHWGVSVLEATGEMDAGPLWAWREFPLRSARKGSLYRFEITAAATEAVLEAIHRRCDPEFRPLELQSNQPPFHGRWRNAVTQAERRIDWHEDDTGTVLRKLRSADGQPGVVDQLLDVPCRLFDAHLEGRLQGTPGTLLARRGPALCRATRDGAIWIGHVQRETADGSSFKLPAVRVLQGKIAALPETPLDIDAPCEWATYREIRYQELGPVGVLHFDFYNGAMNTDGCRRLLAAYRAACLRPTRIIVLAGGTDFWSNGIDLNQIEAAASPADESWDNIEAMDDLAAAIIGTTDRLTLAALTGNAGAGGAFLALAADQVVARAGTILNPHYKNMGNLYGSEYWTYLLPRRLGVDGAAALVARRLPIGTAEAVRLGLIDAELSADPLEFPLQAIELATGMARDRHYPQRLRNKRKSRERDESERPLADYRAVELERMRLNFYGFDPSYHVARYRFVHKTPYAWTPRHLAVHRRLDRPAQTARSASA